MTIVTATAQPVPVTQFLGIEDDPATGRLVLELGTPEGRVLQIACSYRAAHLVAAALARWQGYRVAEQAKRRTARLADDPGKLPCCP